MKGRKKGRSGRSTLASKTTLVPAKKGASVGATKRMDLTIQKGIPGNQVGKSLGRYRRKKTTRRGGKKRYAKEKLKRGGKRSRKEKGRRS